MSFLGKLLGTDKATETIIDQSFSLLDKSFYTKQEQGEAALKAEAEARGLVVKWLEATTGSRLARRLLAIMITGTWLSMFVIGTLASITGIWMADPEDVRRLNESATLLDARIEHMTGAVMLILSFYFAAPYMGDVVKGALDRLGKK